jgi:hypothetical protein
MCVDCPPGGRTVHAKQILHHLSYDITVEIGALTEASRAELKNQRWRLYGSAPPPRISRDLLTRALAYPFRKRPGVA